MRLFELIRPSDSYSDAWKRAEAKGLPMDRESRMARAEAMGFDTGTVYYKGMYPYDWNKETENDPGPEITKIHRSTIFPAFSGDEPGIRIAGFFTPDPKVANDFSMVTGSAGYPVFLKFTNVFTMDARGRTAGSSQFGDSGGAFRDVVRSGKYDIVKINNTEDEGNLVVVIDPRNIRSIHAAFDPDNVDSPDLLEVSMRPAKAASGQLSESRGTPCIVVDVQPAYTGAYGGDELYWVDDMMQFLNKQLGPILMFVNAEQTDLSEDTIDDIRQYWEDSGFDPNGWHRVQIVDKGFGSFHGWMDQDISNAVIIKAIRLMYQNKVNDSRELFGGEDSDDYAINMEMGLGIPERVLVDPLIINWTSVAQLKNFSGAYIMGGGRNECLREVELLMNAFNIKYKRIEEFVYG